LEYAEGKTLAKYNAEGVTHADMEKAGREAYEIMSHRCRYEGGTHCGVPYITYNNFRTFGAGMPQGGAEFCSEGDGYMLLAAAIYADQPTFNGLWMWIHDNRLSKVKKYADGSWLRQGYFLPDGRPALRDPEAGVGMPGWNCFSTDGVGAGPTHSAADGDYDIAMALLIAYKQWGEFMYQHGVQVRDGENNPISYKKAAQDFIKAMVDTVPYFTTNELPNGYLTGDIGVDGYPKGGNSWGELTNWRATQTMFGAELCVIPSMGGGGGGASYVDYNSPAYFNEFAHWLENEDGDGTPWQINQFKRAEASSDWVVSQLNAQGGIGSVGKYQVNANNTVTFSPFNAGEDFRFAWRHVLNYLWHGNPTTTWNPATHAVEPGGNTFEYELAQRHANFMKEPKNGATVTCAKMGASPDPGQPSWSGPAQIRQSYFMDGGIQDASGSNYALGCGAPAAVASEDLSFIADMYRQSEIVWDDASAVSNSLSDDDRYINSMPKYFHGWFRNLGMLTNTGNLHAPRNMVPQANMKVYMSVDKTYAYQGDEVTYTVQYRNYGSANATDVTVVTELDPNYEFVSANKGGALSGNTIVWNVGSVTGFKTGGLAATIDSMQFTVKVKDTLNPRICLTSTISGSNFDDWVSNEFPNHATYTMERNCVDILANRSLYITKTANRTSLNPDDVVTFTVDFGNKSEGEDSWLNGGRDNVRISYGNYYMPGSAYQFYQLYRFWNDSYEAYINMNNYRVSYFMYDAAAIGLYDAQRNTTGWTFVVDNQNDLDKYGYNPASGPITFAYQKIPQGEDANGKWNQRLMIRFADVLMAPSTHVYDKLDSQYLLHKGVYGPGFIRARLASNPNQDLTTRVQDDWSFSTDVTENSLDGQGTTFTLISPAWANYDNPGYEINNYSRHVCNPTSAENYGRILVEEFDGYTWRRIQGTGPLPGKEAYNVTIADTIPYELEWVGWVDSTALKNANGEKIQATYTPAAGGAGYSGIVRWTIPEMLVGEADKLVYRAKARDLGCPLAVDTNYDNVAWIWSDTDSPDSSMVTLMTTCAELPPVIEPQTSLFKTANTETAEVGDVISYELKFVNTEGTRVEADCNTTTGWQALGSGSLPAIGNGGLKLSTTGNGAYFFAPEKSYGGNGAVYATIGGSPQSSQEMYLVMRYVSGTPGQANFRGVCIQMMVNKDGKNNFGYRLYNDGTLVKEEGLSWADAMQFPGNNDAPTFKFVLEGDHLYMYVNDFEDEWTNVSKDWSGLTSAGPGHFGMYVNSNGNSSTVLSSFVTELDYAFDIALFDNVPAELGNVTAVSDGGTWNTITNQIAWSPVATTAATALAPNAEIIRTFDAEVLSCNKYINNYGLAKVYGLDTLKVMHTVTCGTPIVCTPDTTRLNDTILVGESYIEHGFTIPIQTAASIVHDTLQLENKALCDSIVILQLNVLCVSDTTYIPDTILVGESYNKHGFLLPVQNAVGTVSDTLSMHNQYACDSLVILELEVIATDAPVPTVKDYEQCKDETPVDISTLATADADHTLYWYTDSTAAKGTGSLTPPLVSTSTPGEYNFYVSQKNNTTQAESDKVEITVTVYGVFAPTVSADTLSYCYQEAPLALTAGQVDSLPHYRADGFEWYENGVLQPGVPVVDTEVSATTTYKYEVGQTYTIASTGSVCKGALTELTVIVTRVEPPLTQEVTYLRSDVEGGQFPDLLSQRPDAIDPLTDLNWYDEDGTTLLNEVPRPPVPSASEVGDQHHTYYVSRTENGCESEKTAINATVYLTPVPQVSDVSYCQGETATPLTATADISQGGVATDYQLLWHNTPDDPSETGSMVAPTPSTLVPGEYTYYVSQKKGNGAESEKVKVVVTVYGVFAPTVSADTLSYCYQESPLALTAGQVDSLPHYRADGFEWYENGVLQPGVPVVDTEVSVTTTYKYEVGQTYTIASTGSVCKGALTELTVIVTRVEPPLTQEVTYLRSDAVSGQFPDLLSQRSDAVDPLTDLNWYDEDGTTLLNEVPRPPVPSASEVGDQHHTYYVSRTENGCESEKTAINATVYLTPVPQVSDVSYCQGETATPLTATADISQGGVAADYQLLWHNTPDDPSEIGNPVAPIPSTLIPGEYTYYVSQKKNTGAESSRVPLKVTIHANPVIIVTDPEAVCETTVDITGSWKVDNGVTPVTAQYYEDASGSVVLSTPSAVSTTGVYYIQGSYQMPSNYQGAATCKSNIAPVKVDIHDLTLTIPTISGSQTTCPNTSVSLSAVAVSTNPNTITYSWSGSNGDSGNGDNFTSSPLSGTAETTYTFNVIATSGKCQKNSQPFTVTIGDGPIVGTMTVSESGNNDSPKTFAPSDVKEFYSCGDAVTISVDYIKTSGDYVWTDSNGTQVGMGASLTVSPSNTETYMLTFTNQCPTSTQVTIHPVPLTVTTANSAMEICENTPFEATLTITCQETPTISWYKDNTALTETTNKYTLAQAKASDSGVYTYSVVNRGCRVDGSISNGTPLKVKPYIEFTNVPEYVIERGKDVTIPLQISVPSGSVPSTIKWIESGSTVYNGTSYTHTVDRDYRYTIEMSDPNYCDAGSEVTVLADASLRLSVNLAQKMCVGDQGINLEIDTTGTGRFVYPDLYSMRIEEEVGGHKTELSGWQLNGNKLFLEIHPNSDATYVVKQSYNGRELSDTVSITVLEQIKITYSPTPTVCAGEQVTLSLSSVSPVGTVVTWSDPDNTIQGSLIGDSVKATPLFQSGSGHQFTYRYQITANYDICQVYTGEVTVKVDEPLTGTLSSDSPICEGETVTLDASSYGADEYAWHSSNLSGSHGGATLTDRPLTGARYYVAMTRSKCAAVDSIEVSVNSRPRIVSIDSVGIRDRAVIVLDGYGTPPFDYGVDQEVATPDPVKRNLSYAVHSFYIQDAIGCKSIAQAHLVEAPAIFPPVWFSPNGDGSYDNWEVPGLAEVYPEAEVTIFDRFGKKLVEYKGAESGWDGVYQGKAMPSTDYWYQIDIEEIDKQYVGHFTLIR
jgi:gliding motility-associated-like protein/uncharacterized repeat protein (TIGR01451 family)